MSDILEFVAESRRRRGDHAEFWTGVRRVRRVGGARRAEADQGHRGEEQGGPRWLRNLGDALGGHGRRLGRGSARLAGCAAADASQPVSSWLDRVLPDEGPDQDLFGIVREAGGDAGSTWSSRPGCHDLRAGRPAEFGRPVRPRAAR